MPVNNIEDKTDVQPTTIKETRACTALYLSSGLDCGKTLLKLLNAFAIFMHPIQYNTSIPLV